MIWFAIPPLITRFRKKRAIKKGVDFKPLFPKTKEKMDRVKDRFNLKKKNDEQII